MNQEKIFEGLIAIADEIEVAEKPWLQAWARINAPASETADVSGAQLCDDLAKAEEALVAVIASKAAQVAELTGNSVDNIRLVLVPRKQPGEQLYDGLMPGFPRSGFLRQVAKHRSFNSDYWASEERRVEREAFLEKANPTDGVMAPDEAAMVMKHGGVPNVSARDFERVFGSLSALERAMVSNGLLKPYDKSYSDRVSTTQSVAFNVMSDIGEDRFVYWTKGVARERMESSPAHHQAERAEAPRG
jgi:hypothetical protein